MLTTAVVIFIVIIIAGKLGDDRTVSKGTSIILQYSRKSNQMAKRRVVASISKKYTLTQRVNQSGYRNGTSDLV